MEWPRWSMERWGRRGCASWLCWASGLTSTHRPGMNKRGKSLRETSVDEDVRRQTGRHANCGEVQTPRPYNACGYLGPATSSYCHDFSRFEPIDLK